MYIIRYYVRVPTWARRRTIPQGKEQIWTIVPGTICQYAFMLVIVRLSNRNTLSRPWLNDVTNYNDCNEL
jgi:hypothetical protein